MSKGDATRERMVASAHRLFTAQGYAATGLKQIIEEGEAPRGSLYFHFPGGKEELAVAVVERHSEQFARQVDAAIRGSKDMAGAARAMIEALAKRVEGGGGVGCPVGAVALEMAECSDVLRQATHGAFSTWLDLIAGALVDEGASEQDAQRRARVLLCAIEGALVLSRAAGDGGPLRDVASVVPALLKA